MGPVITWNFILSQEPLWGGKMGFCHLPCWGQNALFPVLHSHLQLTSELVTAVGVASALRAVADSRKKQWAALFSQCGDFRSHPCHLWAASALLSVTWPIFPEHLCPQQLLKPVPAPSPSHSGPGIPRHEESAKEDDLTELGPGGASAARFLSKADRFCPNVTLHFPPTPGREAIVNLL